MTQNERLRALLKEARDALDPLADCLPVLMDRIDAALAEPDEHPMPPECTKCNELAKDWWELQSENSTLKAAMKGTHWATDLIVKQRDEARADVATAYQRGAEAMRAAAMTACNPALRSMVSRSEIVEAIRNVQTPEDK